MRLDDDMRRVVEQAAPLVSPAHDGGADETAIAKRWRDHHMTVAAARLDGLRNG